MSLIISSISSCVTGKIANSVNGLLAVLLCVLLFASCKSEYDQYVKREMATEMFHDSLIFDMKLGMTKKDFYSICWDLNKTGVIVAGSGNEYARHIERAENVSEGELLKQMDFFGTFDEDNVMHGMEMIYSYQAWAPWNARLQSDKLALELKEKFGKEYSGNPFIEIDLKKSEYKAFVKIDGNRQILIYPKSVSDVTVLIEDLNYKFKK